MGLEYQHIGDIQDKKNSVEVRLFGLEYQHIECRMEMC